MKSTTLQKPNGETFQVNDRRTGKKQMNLQINGATGFLGNGNSNDEEMLLPTGFSLQDNGQIETYEERLKRVTTNQKTPTAQTQDEDAEMLLPAGVILNK
ncbi:MAG: hypothetical protein WD016_02960 [Balneolaceae bacterium]